MKAFKAYLKEVNTLYGQDEATEHSYRPAFERLLKREPVSFPEVINEPKQIECGAPDFVVKQAGLAIGHIETKPIHSNLDVEEKTEQLKRYLDGLGNLILTNYIEFRHYVDGELRGGAKLAEYNHKTCRYVLDEAGGEDVELLFTQFRDHADKAPKISTGKELARRMAGAARQMRHAILEALKLEAEEAKEAGKSLPGMPIHEQLEGFRQVLLHDLTAEDFADMQAQTICYGLYTGRMNTDEKDTFTRQMAHYKIPSTNPFLAKTFVRIGGADLDKKAAWAADELVAVLNRTEMDVINGEFSGHTRKGDPIVYFYEGFLEQYDPRIREERGVYYTPGPVISYIVRSVDEILKGPAFGIADGLRCDERMATADGGETHRLHILDPAVGTGAFLISVLGHIKESYFKGLEGMWPAWVKEHLMPRLHGFEFLMAPYTIAHLNMGQKLKDFGVELKSDERFNIFLTNSLEEPHDQESVIPFTGWLREEAAAATGIKRDAPVMVVIGNPPYSGHSANPSQKPTLVAKGRTYEKYDKSHKKPRYVEAKKELKAVGQRTFLGHLLHGWDPVAGAETGSYFHVDGAPLDEKNPKWLNDDYVKFIRFAQWRIERTGQGIVGFIVNHEFMDNPTFRGMRQSLLQSYDQIYMLDLHGSTKKKEQAPDGSKDENVFGIMQGVAILLCVREKDESGAGCEVRHAEVWGPTGKIDPKSGDVIREGKFVWLLDNDVTTTDWAELKPKSPEHLFVPRDEALEKEVGGYWPLKDICKANTIGFVTSRDHFAVALEQNEMLERVKALRNISKDDEELRKQYKLKDNRDWQLAKARQKIQMNADWQKPLSECTYRPFDNRWCYFDYAVMDFPRRELLDHVFDRDNLCLGVGRQGKAVNDPEWNLVFCADMPIDFNIFRRGGVTVFPLYLYPPEKAGDLDEDGQIHSDLPSPQGPGVDGRRANLDREFLNQLSAATDLEFIPDGAGDLKASFGPEDVQHYIYALLHAPSYRSRYGEFLKTDFPRIPLPPDKELFAALAPLGARLSGLHLFKESGPDQPDFPVAGGAEVEKHHYDGERERVHINPGQYFAPVTKAVWEFRVGGYLPAQKWLKDRKGRKLSADDLAHYRKMIGAIAGTISVMAEIDRAIEQAGGWPLSRP